MARKKWKENQSARGKPPDSFWNNRRKNVPAR
jgi:hypothetical protein